MTSTSLHTVVRGEGNPVLFLHGNPVDHHFMLPLDPAFEDFGGIERVYVDMPGYGKTPADDAIDSTESVATRVTSFVREYFEDRPFAVVGNSFGGMIARHLAAELPDQVTGMALLCPAVIPDFSKRTLPPKKPIIKDEEFLKTLAPGDRGEFAAVEVHLTPQQWELFKTHALPGISHHDKAAVKRIRADYAFEQEPEDRGEPYTKPVVIITGRQDFIVGYRDQFNILDHYPHGTYAILDDAGHNAHLDKPDEVYFLLYDWVKRIQW